MLASPERKSRFLGGGDIDVSFEFFPPKTAAMEETRRNPGRFDHTKLVRDSTWEFCKWDRVDTIGFLICCAVSGAIIGIFVLLLKWAA